MKICILPFILFLGCKSTQVQSKPLEESKSQNLSTTIEYYDNDSVKSVGKIDLDFLSKKAKVGLWNEFYDNGKLKEAGNYMPDFYTNCCTMGYCSMAYNYKIGEWEYYHRNGQLRAKGIYDIRKKHIDTSCKGGDEINFGYITESWKFYDKNGKGIILTKKQIREIEKNGFLDN